MPGLALPTALAKHRLARSVTAGRAATQPPPPSVAPRQRAQAPPGATPHSIACFRLPPHSQCARGELEREHHRALEAERGIAQAALQLVAHAQALEELQARAAEQLRQQREELLLQFEASIQGERDALAEAAEERHQREHDELEARHQAELQELMRQLSAAAAAARPAPAPAPAPAPTPPEPPGDSGAPAAAVPAGGGGAGAAEQASALATMFGVDEVMARAALQSTGGDLGAAGCKLRQYTDATARGQAAAEAKAANGPAVPAPVTPAPSVVADSRSAPASPGPVTAHAVSRQQDGIDAAMFPVGTRVRHATHGLGSVVPSPAGDARVYVEYDAGGMHRCDREALRRGKLSPFITTTSGYYQVGDRVRHTEHGPGTVRPSPPRDERLCVEFDSGELHMYSDGQLGAFKLRSVVVRTVPCTCACVHVAPPPARKGSLHVGHLTRRRAQCKAHGDTCRLSARIDC